MLCADRVIRDTETHNISVINIFEEMTPEGLPLLVPRITVFALLHRNKDEDPSQIKCRFRIEVGNNKLGEHEMSIDFQDKTRNRAVLTINGLLIPTSGVLLVSLLLEERLLNQCSFAVNTPRQINVTKQDV
jgi:hypothetical protein